MTRVAAWSRVRVERVAPLAQVTLRVQPDPAVVERLGRAMDVAIPVAANTVATAGSRSVLWLGPDEWLVVDEDRGATAVIQIALREAAGDAFVVTVDVSDNRVALDLAGSGARELLGSGTPVDLHPRAFPAGSCAQTLLGRANMLIWQRSDEPSYRVFVRPSFAGYLEAWVLDARDGVDG